MSQMKPPIKNNPAFLSDEQLRKAFVVRQSDLQLVVGTIRENTTDANQHILVIGPRGIGKTMLVQRTALEVRTDEELRDKWYPLLFAEESYEVGSVGEFWLESIFHLGRQTNDPKWAQTYDELKREPVDDRLRERALAQLMDFADSQNKRILVVVENLNMILGDQISEDDAWKLRGTLMHEPRIMLLATTTTKIAMSENAGKAMFEMMKPHILKPLDEDECQAVWRSIAGSPLGLRRIRAVSILTGGSPRLIAIISHFGARLSFADLMEDMTSLVDEHTDYFKSQLDVLPSTERKIYVSLADLWDPSTAREVAAASRTSVSKASSLLRRLIGRGLVSEASETGRTKRYQVAERLYNIYYLMRRRGAPSERVKAIVQFMVQFYEETELVEVAKRLTEEACQLSDSKRQYHYHAFEGIIRTTPPDLGRTILKRTPWSFLEAPDRPHSLRRLLIESGIGTDCPCDFQRHPDERIGQLVRRGFDAQNNGALEEAEQAFREALEIDNTYSEAWTSLASVLSDQPARRAEAEQALRNATEAGPNDPCAWIGLGKLLEKDARDAEAENAFRKAIDSHPDCSAGWLGLARLTTGIPGREKDVALAYEMAEQAACRSAESHPNRANHWRVLARIRHRYTKRNAAAETAYRKAIDLDDKSAEAWAGLGSLLHYRLGRYAEAEVAYRKAIQIDDKLASAVGNLGVLLRDEMHQYGEAEKLFETVSEIEPTKARGWIDKGVLFTKQERLKEAEGALSKAIEVDPNDDVASLMLGNLLAGQPQRQEEAERAFRRAIELNPKHVCPRTALVRLLLKELKKPDAALAMVQQSVKDIPDSESLLNQLSMHLLAFGPEQYLVHAEELARKAIALQAKPAYLHTLACVLAKERKTPEALSFTRDVLNDAEFAKRNIDEMIKLFSELVRAGCADEAVTLLHESKSAVALEPISMALLMFLNREVHVAPEIAEVGKDVLRRLTKSD